MARMGAETTGVTVTINKIVYDNIKESSKKIGITPSTWITMI